MLENEKENQRREKSVDADTHMYFTPARYFSFLLSYGFLRVSNTLFVCQYVLQKFLFVRYGLSLLPGGKVDERMTNPNDDVFLSVAMNMA